MVALRLRRILARLLIASISTAVVLELCCGLLASLMLRQCSYSPTARKAFKAELQTASAEGAKEGRRDEPIVVLHPYLGYVYSPDGAPDFHGVPVSLFGFYSGVPAAYRKRDETEFVVGVFGGSVAAHLCARAGRTLEAELAKIPALAGRKIVLNAICQGGWKQPQQLLALDYFSLMGASFDLVVNVDGVNELAHAFMNGTAYGFDLSYPYSWNWLARQNTEDRVLLEQLHVGLQAREERRTVADSILERHLSQVSAARLFWQIKSRATRTTEGLANEKIASRLEELATANRKGLSYQQRGPGGGELGKPAVVLAESVRIWAEASAAMGERLKAKNIPYVHVLQPNQYFEGTKLFTATESAKFVNTNSFYAAPLRDGYPLLLEAGRTLAAHGVEFVDLSRAFLEIPAEIYEDDCCHFNDEGNRILAIKLAAVVAERIK